ncbi:MAG: hypothetical protein H5T97_13500 [Firmicutes bacterium]|nr:hypothetical protein [Bacillota bacterium]
MSWPCRTETAEAYPCGFDPDRCPLMTGRPRYEIETNPEERLLRHFERPGTAYVFAYTGLGEGKALAARLREAGVEVAEAGPGPDPEAAENLAERVAFARARGEKIALFAQGLEALRRWSESGYVDAVTESGRPALRKAAGGWHVFRREIQAGSNERINRLVMALDICDDETARLFGLRKIEPGTAAVLV